MKDNPPFTNRCRKSVTFQGKLDLPIHRWYRLTPSFSPQLAYDIADHWELSTADFVLDPFSGVGTVPLCLKYRGLRACSVEINPYLHFVSTVKTRTYAGIEAIESCFQEFTAASRAALAEVPFRSKPDLYLRENAAYIPRINFPERWWSRGNLGAVGVPAAARRRLHGRAAPSRSSEDGRALYPHPGEQRTAQPRVVDLRAGASAHGRHRSAPRKPAPVDAGRPPGRRGPSGHRGDHSPRKQQAARLPVEKRAGRFGRHHLAPISQPIQLRARDEAPFILLRLYRARRGRRSARDRVDRRYVGQGDLGARSRDRAREPADRDFARSFPAAKSTPTAIPWPAMS